MGAEPRIRVAAASGLVAMLRVAGVDTDRLAREVGLEPQQLADPEATIPVRRFVALFEAAAEAAGDPCLGLRVGLAQTPAQLGVLGYVMVNCPTVREALDALGRYLGAHQEGVELGLDRDGERFVVSYRIADPEIAPRRQDAELTVGLATAFLRGVLGVVPDEVWFEHAAPADPSAHRRLLGCPVRFGRPTNAVLSDPALLERAMPSPDPGLLAILRRHAEAVVAGRDAEASTRARVRACVAARLERGVPPMRAVAKALGMSEATLRRRLDDEGGTFKGELAATRRALAERYLGDRSLTLTDVAFLLGYSDATAFHRAFKRWTGQTPKAFRAAAR